MFLISRNFSIGSNIFLLKMSRQLLALLVDCIIFLYLLIIILIEQFRLFSIDIDCTIDCNFAVYKIKNTQKIYSSLDFDDSLSIKFCKG